MKLVLSHPTGNTFVRAAAEGFLEQQMLLEFHTAVAAFPGSLFDRCGAVKPLAEIRRRRLAAELKPYTKLWPWYEAARLLASKAGFEGLIAHEKGLFCVDAVYRRHDKRVATKLPKSAATAVYAYEDGALESFKAAKAQGISCLYDLPIGYWRAARQLLEAERQRWPEWASTISGFKDSEQKLARKDEELRLADRIIVASQFTARTLKLFTGVLAPVEVVPYAFPDVGTEKPYTGSRLNKPLKVLFVGGLSQRKGIADLFAAAEALHRHITLTVVGYKAAPDCEPLNQALTRHRWYPSLPHHDILKLMREHDVLVFPSLFEGFGLVITEAMSQGTPVITTDRTAGPDLITHGDNGWLVRAGSAQAIQEALEELLCRPALIKSAGKAAHETAKGRPWSVYKAELVEAIAKPQQELARV